MRQEVIAKKMGRKTLEITKTQLAGFLLLSILAGFVIGASLAKPSVRQLASTVDSTGLAERLIRVSGEGRASSKPNLAYAYLAVETISKTAEGAQADNADRMVRVISALRSAGLSESDIETVRYSLVPNYDYQSKPPAIVGYTCRNEIRITVNEVERCGSIVDLAVSSGANQVVSIEFALSPELGRKLGEKALEMAVEDARARAEVIAKALGVRLKGPIGVEQAAIQVPAPRYAIRAEAITPIIPGELQVTAAVSAAFAFE
ncbi:MAG: SIMPL domain-containing protein [Candidatus Bathyarchaeia archaeon]